MSIRRLFSTLFLLIATPALALPGDSNSWWTDTPWHRDDRGFLWYPDPQAEPDKAQPAPEPKKKTYREMDTLEEVQAELKRLKNIAILNPTPENVRTWLEANNWSMDKASTFADTARRVTWATPEVDYNNRSTTVNIALAQGRELRKADFKQNIADLSRDNGIIFFYRSDCRFCHQQSPILKMLEAQYGIQVLAVSMDGGPIPNFPNARPDNGISMKISNGQGITTVPAVYLVKRKTNEAIPIGTGVLSSEEIVERIWIMTKTQPGQEF